MYRGVSTKVSISAGVVKTILDWFRQGRDPDREMYKLSTYLGHANPAGTWWYIEAVPELLKLASERAEQAFREGEVS